MNKKKEVIMHRHYGAIDIGSNAARLLIKRFDKIDGEISCSKELLLRVPLRLGFDVFEKNKISKENEKRLMHLIKSFSHLMRIYGVKKYMACATSALRDANNGKGIVKRLKDKTGVNIHIINGQQEAKGIYNNHSENTEKGNYMYVDVGGGSTEISMISNGVLISSRSYNIGTIRILCNVVDEDEWKRMDTDIAELTEMYTGINIIGSGGNINKLYRLIESRDKKQQRITVKSLADICNKMAEMSVEDRVHTFGLKYDRADVIVPAGSIFLAIAELTKAKYIYVPTIGLSDGIINTLFQNDMRKYNKKYGTEDSHESTTFDSDTIDMPDNVLEDSVLDNVCKEEKDCSNVASSETKPNNTDKTEKSKNDKNERYNEDKTDKTDKTDKEKDSI